ncbi:uncharacterized protein LDX57_011148 [Aspergillus melleus]|uniref:uncharacterized protein n=1 Tax=Aspergillus melleus TaxID=138277 RepID=UPI001E8D0736|nr:uncharacterized protein LDX57_011148 [Aspergillus melleus]KAH8433514.1 hypothetical protein LDX57_011148 [Aspergillus melleus]
MQQEMGQITSPSLPCLHRKLSGLISANVRRDRAEHARKNALVDQGIGLAIDAQGSDDYDYAVVLADLYSPTDTDLSTLRGVLELARAQLRSRHECKAWANPRGKNSAEALRVRFWLQTRAYTAAEIYQE